MSDDVLFSIDGHVATIVLNRPQKLNAVTPEMAKAINAATERCNASEAVRCVVVRRRGRQSLLRRIGYQRSSTTTTFPGTFATARTIATPFAASESRRSLRSTAMRSEAG